MNARKVNSLVTFSKLVNQEIKQCTKNIQATLENLTPEQKNEILKLADSMKISQIGTSQFDVEAIYRELGLCVEINCKTHLISSLLREQLKQQAKTIIEN